ncbi:MAG TPA: hypothetical protein VGB13_02405 [Candidatus Krumholzibacteria bacterium]
MTRRLPVLAAVLGTLVLVLALALYPRPRTKLEVKLGCKTPEVVACLEDYAYDRMRSRDIWRLAAEGLPKCLSEDPEAFSVQATCLPVRVGTVYVSRVLGIPAVTFDGELRLNGFGCCEGGGYPLYTGGGYGPLACLTPEFATLYGEKLELKEKRCGTWWWRLTTKKPPY